MTFTKKNTLPYPSSLLIRAFGLTILLALFLWLTQGALSNATTFDEPSHLGAGYAYLQQGLGGLWTVPLRGHPVLYNALEALPLYVADPEIPVTTMPGWGTDRRSYVTEFIHAVPNLPGAMFAGRFPTILCTLILASVLWRGTADIWGSTAGLLSLLIMFFDPLILAHGRLATNDMAVTAGGSLFLYSIWRWGRKPSWKKTIFCSLLLGCVFLTKATGILYGLVGLGWALWVTIKFKTKYTHLNLQKIVFYQVLCMGILALGIVWTAYGWNVGPTTKLPILPVPAPKHWNGVFFQAENALKRQVFALGFVKTGRWWWYFPVAIFLKNPLPMLLLLAFTAFVFTRWPRTTYSHSANVGTQKKDLRYAGIVLAAFFGLFYIIAALFIGPNIGYRHFLPVQPAFHLFIAGACVLAWQHLNTTGHVLLTLLICWYGIGTLSIFPNEISFFNQLFGGANQGWRYLTTSNTDWLQGWNELKTWQEKTGITFSYAGPEGYLGLQDYGIDYVPLPPVEGASEDRLSPWLFPQPGNYIIGSSILSGMNIVDIDNYSWFRYREPDDIIAHSLYHYQVTLEEVPDWVAQCNIPVVPLDEHALRDGYGDLAIRFIQFDCTRSWIFPDAGHSLGHIILHASQLEPENWRTRLYLSPPGALHPFTARHLQDTSMAARERRDQDFPSFGAFLWTPHDQALPPQMAIAAPAATIPQDLPYIQTSQSEFAFEDKLTFLGTQSREIETGMEVETWWRVEHGIVTRPVSIMAHLLDENGHAVGIADGLDISPLFWENNDILVQRHIFTADCQKDDTLWLRTGIYWLDTQIRWTINKSENDALYVPLCTYP